MRTRVAALSRIVVVALGLMIAPSALGGWVPGPPPTGTVTVEENACGQPTVTAECWDWDTYYDSLSYSQKFSSSCNIQVTALGP